MRKLLLAGLLLLAACAPAAPPAPTPQVITIHASPAAQPWLSETYQCADELRLVLATTDDPGKADLTIRMGEPRQMNLPAYQIGQDDLLVVTQREGAAQNLDAAGAQALFSAPQPSAQIWVYAAGEDIQQTFEREIMQALPVNGNARIAASPQQMAQALSADKNALGLLPKSALTDTLRVVFSLPAVPVLAQTPSEPQGDLKQLLACLQGSK